MSLNVERFRTGGIEALSPREQQVLGLMAQGLSNLAVSRRLSLTRKTIDSHVRSIFAKLGLAPSPASHRRVLAVLVYMGDDTRRDRASSNPMRTT